MVLIAIDYDIYIITSPNMSQITLTSLFSNKCLADTTEDENPEKHKKSGASTPMNKNECKWLDSCV